MIKLLLIFIPAILFVQTEALKCYKCSATSKPDFKECQEVDNSTKIETCKKKGYVCVAVGLDYRNGTNMEYTNIRKCTSDKQICLRYRFGQKKYDVRRCQVCNKDLCNTITMAPRDPSDESDPTKSSPPYEGPKGESKGGAEGEAKEGAA
ncbi:uncharacterized protein LOC123674954 [Harmonia axyridis]|uniref:uncharacterized protein LOC123674954 n=1 Tax=Harmonia axyridis TaxID=115357 RepID=UPI001E27575F|nr:uncharacterized protein LOC123674954 [Harmonia axyridis]